MYSTVNDIGKYLTEKMYQICKNTLKKIQAHRVE